MAEPHDELRPDSPAPNPTPPPDSKGLPKRLRGTQSFQDEVPPTAAGRSWPERLGRALEHAKLAARIAEDNRGKDILLLDLRQATPLVDYFVVATAASRRQANAIAIEIDAEMKRRNELKLGIEGSEEGRWILLDYGDFVVHVFSEEARGYYALEDIWGDAPQLDWADPDRPRPPARPAADPIVPTPTDEDADGEPE
jgi:ribosome-associated protein